VTDVCSPAEREKHPGLRVGPLVIRLESRGMQA
jgi:hypothetical protein